MTCKKYSTLLFVVMLALVLTLALVACTEKDDKQIVGVTFEDLTVAYDGNPHSITITGKLPAGVSVSYGNNTATEAGEYVAIATLYGNGYVTVTLTAKLTIVAPDVDITGVTFEDLTVFYDGNPHEITVSGDLPKGVTVSYYNNTATEAGEYTVTATFSQANRKDVTLTAKLTIKAVDHVIVNNSQELLDALNNGGLILFGGDIVLNNGEVAAITKDTSINGMGYTLSAVNYEKDYRVINISGADVKAVSLFNLNIVADEWVSYLRGINLYETENLTLNIDNVDVKLCDYYALNIIRTNIDLTVNVADSKFSAWAAVYNRASGVTFNAHNCLFEGTNIHPSPNNTSNYFTTFIVAEYVLLNGDEFISENLSANNCFTLTDCEIVSKVALDENGELIDTRQRLVDLRSPYNNSLELVNCTLTPVYYENLITVRTTARIFPTKTGTIQTTL